MPRLNIYHNSDSTNFTEW